MSDFFFCAPRGKPLNKPAPSRLTLYTSHHVLGVSCKHASVEIQHPHEALLRYTYLQSLLLVLSASLL